MFRNFKKGYISIEIVILASIVIIGGMCGLSAFLNNGQNAQGQMATAMNNTIDEINEEFSFGDAGTNLPDEPAACVPSEVVAEDFTNVAIYYKASKNATPIITINAEQQAWIDENAESNMLAYFWINWPINQDVRKMYLIFDGCNEIIGMVDATMFDDGMDNMRIKNTQHSKYPTSLVEDVLDVYEAKLRQEYSHLTWKN